MKIIFLSPRQSKSLTLTLNTWAKVALSLCMLGVPLGAGLVIGAKSDRGDASLRAALAAVQAELDLQHEELQLGVASADKKIAAYSKKLAEIQARMVRIAQIFRMLRIIRLFRLRRFWKVLRAKVGPIRHH